MLAKILNLFNMKVDEEAYEKFMGSLQKKKIFTETLKFESISFLYSFNIDMISLRYHYDITIETTLKQRL